MHNRWHTLVSLIAVGALQLRVQLMEWIPSCAADVATYLPSQMTADKGD